MKKLGALTLITTAILLSACGGSDNKKKKDPDPRPQPDTSVTTAFDKYKGTWVNKNNGEIWNFGEENFNSYNYNSYGCVHTDEASLNDIEGVTNYISSNDDISSITLDIIGTTPRLLTKMEQLPDSCSEANLLSQTDLESNFEYMWHTMNDYYAFFEARGIDWQAVYDEYRPQISSSTTTEEFFEVVEEVFREFGDGHLELSNSQYSASGSAYNGFFAEVLRNYSDESQDLGELWRNLVSFNDEALTHLLRDNKLNTYQGADAIRWGHVSENVGYIRIDRVQNMGTAGGQEDPDNFIEALAGIEQDIEITDTIMQAALADMQSSEALIIDLRFNSGGYDNVSLKIASYFSDKDQVIGTKQAVHKHHQGEVYQLTLTESLTEVYSKPVYVITGRSTGSGGEVLSMAFKALPQVTMIGEPTNGSVSDSLGHQLPNGWGLSLSHEVYKDNEGIAVESIGVTPDFEMPAYATQDAYFFSNTPIDFIMQQLGEIPSAVPDKSFVDSAFDTFFAATNVPGVAVAVIKDDKIVYQHAYGMANLAEDISVTMDTPFNVGSVSKSVLAVGIMQQVEKGNISLDDQLAEMNLMFDPNNPLNNDSENQITLRHLVTHTSGIRDSLGYNCSYYLHENDASLYQMFGVEYCPAAATSDPTTFYAMDYFSNDGKYVMDGIYNDDEDGLPGESHDYTNVGAGLAAYAIEQKLGIDFAQTMKQDIFIPLNLANTSWHHTELSEDNAKAVQYTLDEDLDPIELPEFSYPTFYDGDLNISANDLAKFLITIVNGGEYQGTRILKKETVETMLKAQTDAFGMFDTQGVFWHKKGSFIGHDGGDPGTNAIMKYNLETKTGVVILMNGEDDHLGESEVGEMLLPLTSTLYRYGLGQ